MTKRRDTTGGPKPSAKPKAPRAPKKAKEPSKIDALRMAVANAPLDLMLMVSVEYISPGIYEAQWTEDGLRRTYRGTHSQLLLWVCACVAEGRLLPAMTNYAIDSIREAMAGILARKAA